jgi:hypothetical protein
MASNKKGSYSGTGHLHGSFWKHLKKEGKQQFWKKERHLTEINLKESEANEKGGPSFESPLSKNARKRRKKHKQILKAVIKRGREKN